MRAVALALAGLACSGSGSRVRSSPQLQGRAAEELQVAREAAARVNLERWPSPVGAATMVLRLLLGVYPAHAFRPLGLGAAARRSIRRCSRQAFRMLEDEVEPLDFVATHVQNRLDIVTESLKDGFSWHQAWADVHAGDYDREVVRAKLRDYIDSSPVVMFVREDCPACKKALSALEMAGATVRSILLDDCDIRGPQKRAVLGRMTGRTSVPFIFIGGEYVGGFNEGVSKEAPGISDLAFEGKLAPLLEAAGAFGMPEVKAVRTWQELEIAKHEEILVGDGDVAIIIPSDDETSRREGWRAARSLERQTKLSKYLAEEKHLVPPEKPAAKSEEEMLAAETIAKADNEKLAADAAANAEEERLAAEATAKAQEQRLATEAAAEAEKERLAAEAVAKAEKDRLAAEAAAKADEERLAAEADAKAEEEKLAAEAAAKAEKERLAEEAAAEGEKERLAAAAAAKAEEERLAVEAAAKAEEKRLAAETAAKAEKDRLAAEAAAKAEEERLAEEAAAKAEEERLAAETAAKAEKERLAAEAAAKAEKERLAEEAAAKAEEQRLAAEAAAKAEKDRLAAEAAAKAEEKKLAAEAAAKAEEERLAAAAAAKVENLRLASEAAAKAPVWQAAEAAVKAEKKRLAAEATAKQELRMRMRRVETLTGWEDAVEVVSEDANAREDVAEKPTVARMGGIGDFGFKDHVILYPTDATDASARNLDTAAVELKKERFPGAKPLQVPKLEEKAAKTVPENEADKKTSVKVQAPARGASGASGEPERRPEKKPATTQAKKRTILSAPKKIGQFGDSRGSW